MLKSLFSRFQFIRFLIHGDTLVLDRWRFICRYLPVSRGNTPKLIDIGCGSGAFSMGAALRGHRATGLSWDRANQAKAETRSLSLGIEGKAEFPIGDARQLGELGFEQNQFNYALCMENAEHIIDDQKLLSDIAALLKPGGVLIFSAPYRFYIAITDGDNAPFCTTETGWHARRGYSRAEIHSLLKSCNLELEEINLCSGFLSQKATWMLRVLGRAAGYRLAWVLVLPLRPIVYLLDRFTLAFWPGYSITAVALKPRFSAYA